MWGSGSGAVREWEKGEGGSKGGRVRERGVKCTHRPWARIVHEVRWSSVGAHCPWCILSMGVHHLWAHIAREHVSVMGGGSLLSVGTHHLWVHMVCSWGGLSFMVADHCCRPWVVGKGDVVPMCCRLHGQAPVRGRWVPFVGTGHRLWALGPLQVVGGGWWGSFACG